MDATPPHKKTDLNKTEDVPTLREPTLRETLSLRETLRERLTKPLQNLNSRYLLTPKLLYLTIELTYATLGAFRFGFIVNGMGIKPTEYSVMYGYCMMISFSSNILIAYIFDYLDSPKFFFIFLLSISGMALQFICWFKYFYGYINRIMFWILMFVYFTFNGSLIPLLDRHVLSMLPVLGGHVSDYGQQRMFGTLAVPMASFMVESILKINTQDGQKYNFDNVKYYHAVVCFLAVFCVWVFVKKVHSNSIKKDSIKLDTKEIDSKDSTKNIDSKDIEKDSEKLDTKNIDSKDIEKDSTGNIDSKDSTEKQGGEIDTEKQGGEIDTEKQGREIDTEKQGAEIDTKNIDSTNNRTETQESNAQESSNQTENNRPSLLSLLTNIPYIYFITIIFINGISRQSMTLFFQNYRSTYLELEPYNLSQFNKVLQYILYIPNNNPISTTDTMGTIIEISCYFNSRIITETFGLYWPIIIGQVAAILRFVSYYSMTATINSDRKGSYVVCCVIEILRGLNYGLTHIAGVQLVLYMCPSNLKGTSQMIYCGVIGLGGAVAGRIAKYLFDKDKMGMDEYRRFFGVNVCLNCVCLFMVFLRYGLVERVLFRRRGASRSS